MTSSKLAWIGLAAAAALAVMGCGGNVIVDGYGGAGPGQGGAGGGAGSAQGGDSPGGDSALYYEPVDGDTPSFFQLAIAPVPMTCGLSPFDCTSPWTLFIDIDPNQLTIKGTYPLVNARFSTAKSGGNPVCFGKDGSIDEGSMTLAPTGSTVHVLLTGLPPIAGQDANGAYTASYCGQVCAGTGELCTSDKDCCLNLCSDGGHCSP